MSRTRKDRPYWVRSNDPSEDRTAYHFIKSTGQYGMPTLLDCTSGCTVHTSQNLPRSQWRQDTDPCGYVLNVSRNYHNTPSRAERRTAYHRPNRTAARQYAKRAREAYNSDQDWEDEGIPERANRSMKEFWRW